MGQRYTINIIVVMVLTFAMYAYLKYSKQGYEISVVGESENTARYAGINVRRVTCAPCCISGAICGLCGFLIVAGKDQTISTTVARRPRLHRHYCGLAGQVQHLLYDADLLPAGLSWSAAHRRSLLLSSLNEYAADIITGIILFFILGSEFFINYRLILARRT